MTMTDEAMSITSTVSRDVRDEIEQFLFAESELLDEWRLHEWLELFGPEGHYVVPTTNLPDGDPTRDLVLIYDDRFMLEQRVNSLLTRAAHAEYPHSRTRRLVTNLRVQDDAEDRFSVFANFAVYRARGGQFDTYVGQYRHVIERSSDTGFRFLVRKAVLVHDTLTPQGKVSIIL